MKERANKEHANSTKKGSTKVYNPEISSVLSTDIERILGAQIVIGISASTTAVIQQCYPLSHTITRMTFIHIIAIKITSLNTFEDIFHIPVKCPILIFASKHCLQSYDPHRLHKLFVLVSVPSDAFPKPQLSPCLSHLPLSTKKSCQS